MRAHFILPLITVGAHATPGGWGQSKYSKEVLSIPSPKGLQDHSKAPAASHFGAAGWSHSEETSFKAIKTSSKYSKIWKSPPSETSFIPVPVHTTTKVTEKPKWSPSPCTTSTSSTLTCPHVCHLDFFGTILAYPTVVEYSSVYAQTVNVYVTEYSDGTPGQSSEETITALPAIPDSPLTWTAFGVVLTYPTTYVAYTSINFATVIPITAESTCATTSAPLEYPTIWPSLIRPSSEIQQPGSTPPATIIAWLDSLPTVQAQLGGGVCDPQNGGVATFVPTATVTTATTIEGNTRIVHSTTVSVLPSTTAIPNTTATTPSTAPPPSSSSTVAVVTTNAAADPRKPSAEKWLGNALAAIVLAL